MAPGDVHVSALDHFVLGLPTSKRMPSPKQMQDAIHAPRGTSRTVVDIARTNAVNVISERMSKKDNGTIPAKVGVAIFASSDQPIGKE